MGIDGSAFAIGTVLARKEGVGGQAATNAGLMMGFTGMSPVGLLLAQSTIRSAQRRKQKSATGDGTSVGATLGLTSDGSGNNQSSDQTQALGQPMLDEPIRSELESALKAVTEAANAVRWAAQAQTESFGTKPASEAAHSPSGPSSGTPLEAGNVPNDLKNRK